VQYGVQLPLQFYQYRIADRGDFNPILQGKALFQQYVVDAYVKVEETRLEWQRKNQKKLRVESYKGLSDYLQLAADQRGAIPGRMVVLGSSFAGGPRNMQQNYQDAMAICRKFGKPFLFITMTCNPNWPEIQDNLLDDQTASDRPDLVSKVFYLKLKALQHDILDLGILGKVEAHCMVCLFAENSNFYADCKSRVNVKRFYGMFSKCSLEALRITQTN
jgi:hypothetical protein